MTLYIEIKEDALKYFNINFPLTMHNTPHLYCGLEFLVCKSLLQNNETMLKHILRYWMRLFQIYVCLCIQTKNSEKINSTYAYNFLADK